MQYWKRRHFGSPKIETHKQPALWPGRPWRVARVDDQLPVGSFRPNPHPEMSIVRLCSLLSAQPGGVVLIFWVCQLPNISRRVSRRNTSRFDIHPPTLSPSTASQKPVRKKKRQRQAGESARRLVSGISADRTTRAREKAHLSACSAMDLSSTSGSSATPASATGRRENKP